jgi:PcaR/PcaU/PobR family beta-ketoadipate pathway transcriptional regulator
VSARNQSSSGTEDVRRDGIQSVRRALTILELFDDRRPALRMSEIAELTGLNRATSYRFCQTLLALGYLEEADERRLRPGLKALSLALSALKSRELPELALPYLRELRGRTGETVNMALLDGVEVVYVARVVSDQLMSLRLYVGSRLPAYASSLGRAVLAFLPETESDRLIAESRLEKITANTIVDPRRLRAEFRRIRARGYAVNDQEIALGLTGVAAPILSGSGRPIAAVNISLPRPLKSPREIEDVLGPKVVETAQAISALTAPLSLES